MGSFRPAGLDESQKALVGALERASIACGVSVQKGTFVVLKNAGNQLPGEDNTRYIDTHVKLRVGVGVVEATGR